jgi:hypothetical protein
MNFANRQETLFAPPCSTGWMAIGRVAFGADRTVFPRTPVGIDHTPGVNFEGDANNVGHFDPTLKIGLASLDRRCHDKHKKDLRDLVQAH